MHLEAKQKITKGIDALEQKGKHADAVTMCAATARAAGIHATELDWSGHQDADQIAAELMSPKYDERPEHDPHPHTDKATGAKSLYKPMNADRAKKVAEEACQKHLRRPVKLAVRLDESIPEGQYKVTGHDVREHEELV
jgi:hypothetical protein